MNLDDIRYIVVLTNTPNYTRASERLGISRQALHSAIKKLESELGGALFTKNSGKLAPTQLGKYIFPECEKVLIHYERIEKISSAIHSMTPPLLLSVSQLLFPNMVPELTGILSSFRSENPEAAFDWKIDRNEAVTDQYALETVNDALFVRLTDKIPGRFITLKRFPLTISMFPTHPLAGKKELLLSDLEGYTLTGTVLERPFLSGLCSTFAEAGISMSWHAFDNTLEAYESLTSDKNVLLSSPAQNSDSLGLFETRQVQTDIQWEVVYAFHGIGESSELSKKLAQHLLGYFKDDTKGKIHPDRKKRELVI